LPKSISILKKIQNGIVLLKKKSQRVATGFCRVNPLGRSGHDFSYFFFNPARFQPRVDPPGRAGLKKYDYSTLNLFF
jgi:hypothetical protein